MGLCKVINEELINETIKKSRDSPRGRVISVLSPPEKPGLRFLVNAIQPESYIQPHLHDSDEAFGILAGELEIVFFDESGKVTEKYQLSQRGNQLVEVPTRVYHTVLALEPDSCILDLSVGPYNPNEFKKFAPWAPSEPKDGVSAYSQEIHDFMSRLRGK